MPEPEYNHGGIKDAANPVLPDHSRGADSGRSLAMQKKPATPTEESRLRWYRSAQTVSLIVLMFCGFLLPGQLLGAPDRPTVNTESSASQAPDFPLRDEDRGIRVYDVVDILTAGQEASLEGELARLRGLGIEALIYTRISDDSTAASQEFADRLRSEWSVQSVDGVDNGIVYLITVNPAAPETNSILISTGANTFPIRQLDHATMQNLLDGEISPQVEEGEFNQALLFGVRRVLNHADYTPPEPAGLSPWQDNLRFGSNILAASLLQLAAIGYFLVPALRDRQLSLLPSVASLSIYAVMTGALAIVTGIVAIASRNAFGSLAALGVVFWAGCVVPILIGFLSRRRDQPEPTRHEHTALDPAPMIGQSNG